MGCFEPVLVRLDASKLRLCPGLEGTDRMGMLDGGRRMADRGNYLAPQTDLETDRTRTNESRQTALMVVSNVENGAALAC